MISPQLTILMVDDPDDAFFVRGLLGGRETATGLGLAGNGEGKTGALRQEGELKDGTPPSPPGLIVLDLNSPKMNGTEALREIRADPLLRHTPVLVCTTSNDRGDECSYQAIAKSFMVKPASYARLVSVLALLMDYCVQSVEPPTQCD